MKAAHRILSITILVILLINSVVVLAEENGRLIDETNSEVFNDISDNDPNKRYIYDLYYKGIVEGTGNHKFSPNLPLTREQFVIMIVKAFDIQEIPNSTPFNDLIHSWSTPYIQTAFHSQVVNGTSSSTFSPTQPLQRQAAATIVWNYLKTRVPQVDLSSKVAEVDADAWATESVQSIVSLGLRVEKEVTVPYRSKEIMTRGEAAALISLSKDYLDYDSKMKERNVTYKDGVIHLNKDIINQITSTSDDEISLIRSDVTDTLEEGAIIILPHSKEYPLGLAKKIVNIADDDEIITLTVSEPTFDEVVQEINVFDVIDLSTSSLIMLDDTASLASGRKEVGILADGPKIEIEQSINKLKVKVKNLKFDELELSGELALVNPKLILDIDYQDNKLKSYHLEFKTEHSGKITAKLNVKKREHNQLLTRFIVPVPNTFLGVEFGLYFKLKADGSFLIELREDGYLNVGVKDSEPIGVFYAKPEIDVKAQISSTVSLSNTMYPALLQFKQEFIGIETGLAGIKAEIYETSTCINADVSFVSDSKMKVDVSKKIHYELVLYDYKYPLYKEQSCEEIVKQDDPLGEKKIIGDFEITVHGAKKTYQVPLDLKFYGDSLTNPKYDVSEEKKDYMISSDEIGNPEEYFVVVDATVKNIGTSPRFLGWTYLLQNGKQIIDAGYTSNASSWGYTLEENLMNDGWVYFKPGDEKKGYFYFPYVKDLVGSQYGLRVYDKDLGNEPNISDEHIDWVFILQ